MCRTITIVYRCACCFSTTSSTLETIICEEKRVECQLVTQAKRMGKENALYYLSRMLVGAEHAYSPIEKHCLALVFAVKKLRHYMLTHQVTLISKIDPLKYLMTRPMLTGRLAKWAIVLTEFDLTYMPGYQRAGSSRLSSRAPL